MYSPQFQAGSTKIVGEVYTVKLVPKADTTSPRLSGHYVYQNLPPDFLFAAYVTLFAARKLSD